MMEGGRVLGVLGEGKGQRNCKLVNNISTSRAPPSKKALGFAHRAVSLCTAGERLTHLGVKLFMLQVLGLGLGITYRV